MPDLLVMADFGEPICAGTSFAMAGQILSWLICFGFQSRVERRGDNAPHPAAQEMNSFRWLSPLSFNQSHKVENMFSQIKERPRIARTP